MADRVVTYYDPIEEGVLPDAARAPWVVTGAGGVLASDPPIVRVAGATAVSAYSRTHTRKLVTDRVEIQAMFALRSSSPVWDVSGHVLWIDDGERRLAVAMGTTIHLVDPETGTVLYEIPTALQPGEATRLHWVHLIKRGVERWELAVDGRRVLVWPYVGGAASTAAAAVIGWGWKDAGGSGEADWGPVETGINMTLPRGPDVERWRASMPAPIQSRWNAKHHAFGRATVAVAHTVEDSMESVANPNYGDFTAGAITVESGDLDGTTLPAAVNGWTLAGDTGEFEIVRERIRINESTSPTYAVHTVTEPVVMTPDAGRTWTWALQARVRVDRVETTDTRGRAGAFLIIRNGDRQIGAALVHARDNADRFGWILTDSNPSSALGNAVGIFGDVDPYREHLVELFFTGDRVILFVDGDLIEDAAYDRFTTPTADRAFRWGRDGSSMLRARVDFSDVRYAVSHADLGSRPAFWHRLKERLVFRSGCERNDTLDVWMRHRTQAFEARGTDRVISEIRRVACDDDAELVVKRRPAAWFVNVTYPGVSPVWVDVDQSVAEVTAEFAVDDAPNFTADQLERLVTRYLLPHSALESRFDATPVARLTSASSGGGGGTQFDIAAFDGFAIGDVVEMRGRETGTLLSVTYDSDEGLVDLLTGQVRDFSGNDRTGQLTGTDAQILNTAGLSGNVHQSDPSTGAVEGLRTATTHSPVLSAGFTYAGRFEFGAAHAANWYVLKTASGIGTGGVAFYWAVAGNLLTAFVYDGAGSKTVTIAFNPTALSTFWLGLRWDPATNELTIWRDGVLLATSATTAFTVLDPGVTSIGFAAADSGTSNLWRGDHRDHSLFERALTNAEMLALYNDTTGRSDLRSDPDLFVSYLPVGWPAILATHDDSVPPVAADTMLVASFLGDAWASWTVVADGTGNDDIVGMIDLPGLDGHKLADMVAGHTLRYVSTSAAEDTWVESFGVESGTGAAISERVHVVGTTPVVGTKLWAVNGVHGATSSETAVGNISVQDSTGPVTLYTIPAGSRSRGVHLFDPPLFAGPAKVTAVADGATSAIMQVWGVEEKLNDTGYNLTLNGTTPVVTVMTEPNDGWDTVRVVAMGYVAAARTVTLSAVLCDPAGALTLVSSSAADTQPFEAMLLGTGGDAAIVTGVLDGVTPVVVALADAFASGTLWHVLGIRLGSASAGTITVTLDSGGAADVLVAEFGVGETRKGIDERRIANAAGIGVTLSQAQTTARVLGVFGYDEDGVLIIEAAALDGTDVVPIDSAIRELRGVCTGHVPGAKFVTVTGTAWRHSHTTDALLRVRALHGWTVAGNGSLAFDGILATLDDTDVTLDTVDMQGTWSFTETSTITAYDAPTVTVATLTETYASGDVMRRT